MILTTQKSKNNFSFKIATTVLLILVLKTIAFAQPGTLDNTFSSDGLQTTSFNNYASQIKSTAIQSDGKIVVAGYSNTINGRVVAVNRYNTDGSLDVSFDGDGIATTSIGNAASEGTSVAIQADGKIVVAGYYETVNFDRDFAVVRYNADGSLDMSFDSDGIATIAISAGNDFCNTMAIQSDGKIVLAGYGLPNSYYEAVLVRLNTDGSFDTSFDTDGKVFGVVHLLSTTIYALAIQSDGKILITGIGIPGTYNVIVMRYNSDGSLDTSFDTDGKLSLTIGSNDDAALSIAVQTDGKILLAGYSHSGVNFNCLVVRLNADGSYDTSFDGDGVLTIEVGSGNDYFYDIKVQQNGKIIAAGNTNNGSNNDIVVVRFNSDGTLDTGFDTDGLLTFSFEVTSDDYATSLAVQTNGNIVIGGYRISTYIDFALARIEGGDFIAGNLAHTIDGSQLVLYPNPAQHEVKIDLKESGTVSIYNASGALVSEQNLSEGIQLISVDHFQKGLYLFHIKNNEGTSFQAISCLIN